MRPLLARSLLTPRTRRRHDVAYGPRPVFFFVAYLVLSWGYDRCTGALVPRGRACTSMAKAFVIRLIEADRTLTVEENRPLCRSSVDPMPRDVLPDAAKVSG